jgi:cytochrome c-type biogenesis protein CcmE
MKIKYTIGMLIIAVAVVIASLSFGETMKQYVSIEEAKAIRDDVQVKGALLLEEVRYDMDQQYLAFTIADSSGNRLPVIFSGIKPGNFEQAKEIVAIGRYNGKNFEAERLLVKCPSKYTEQGEQI